MLQESLVKSFELMERYQTCGSSFKDLLKNGFHSSSIEELKASAIKNIKERTLDDLFVIFKAMTNFESFTEYAGGMDAQETIIFCLSLCWNTYAQHEALCRVGEPPNEVFYVLDGKIAVTSVNAREFTPLILQDKIFHMESTGSTLGEASIIFNSNRTASLVPVTESHILTIYKESYMRTLGELVKKANLSRIELIQKIPPFANWQLAQLSSLYKHFIKMNFSYHSTIFREGDSDEFIYIVWKGEVELLKTEKENQRQVPKDVKLMFVPKIEKNPPKVITKLAFGGYFGDEDGFEATTKSCTARVSSFDCVLLKIWKKKVKQNTFYEVKLSEDLVKAANQKKQSYNQKLLDMDQFKSKVQNIQSENLRKKLLMDEGTGNRSRRFIEDKQIFHGLKHESAADLYKKGKLPFMTLDTVPFSQKTAEEQSKEVKQIMESCNTLQSRKAPAHSSGSLTKRKEESEIVRLPTVVAASKGEPLIARSEPATRGLNGMPASTELLQVLQESRIGKTTALGTKIRKSLLLAKQTAPPVSVEPSPASARVISNFPMSSSGLLNPSKTPVLAKPLKERFSIISKSRPTELSTEEQPYLGVEGQSFRRNASGFRMVLKHPSAKSQISHFDRNHSQPAEDPAPSRTSFIR